VVLLLLPLSLAMDDSELDNCGNLAAATVAVALAAAVADNEDGVQWQRWWGHWMAAAAFDNVQMQQQQTSAAA
jgi:hypothetical protein